MFGVLLRLPEWGLWEEKHGFPGAIDRLELSLVAGEGYGRLRAYRTTFLDGLRLVMVRRQVRISVFRGKGCVGLECRGDVLGYERPYDVLQSRESIVLT